MEHSARGLALLLRESEETFLAGRSRPLPFLYEAVSMEAFAFFLKLKQLQFT